MNDGFFKKGDRVEVSGKLIGIVMEANETMFLISRLVEHNSSWFLCPDIQAYSNEAKHYIGKYWIKKVSAPNEYKLLEVRPFNG